VFVVELLHLNMCFYIIIYIDHTMKIVISLHRAVGYVNQLIDRCSLECRTGVGKLRPTQAGGLSKNDELGNDCFV
jgi:hypothetical protein